MLQPPLDHHQGYTQLAVFTYEYMQGTLYLFIVVWTLYCMTKVTFGETEIQPGFESGSSKLQLDGLTTWLVELWLWSRDRHNSIPAGSQV